MNEEIIHVEGEIDGEPPVENEGELHKTLKGKKVNKQLSPEKLEEKRKKDRESKKAKRKAMSPEAKMEENMKRQQRRKRLSTVDLESIETKEPKLTTKKGKMEEMQHTFVLEDLEDADRNCFGCVGASLSFEGCGKLNNTRCAGGGNR